MDREGRGDLFLLGNLCPPLVRWVPESLLFQLDPEDQQILEALVIRWALEVLFLLLAAGMVAVQ